MPTRNCTRPSSTTARTVHKLSIGATNSPKHAPIAGIIAIAGGTKINTAGEPVAIGMITITTSTDSPGMTTLPNGGAGAGAPAPPFVSSHPFPARATFPTQKCFRASDLGLRARALKRDDQEGPRRGGLAYVF